MSTSEGRLPDLTVTAQGAGSSDVAARVGAGPAGGGQRSSRSRVMVHKAFRPFS